ncbi:MAG: FAD:protein FMN transferase ApbE [Leptothrix sp. (in: Bacteria)]|nr:FAD:protein FMN transferase ApbE [Leptothrix sp. (in: b-proteobacteria)]
MIHPPTHPARRAALATGLGAFALLAAGCGRRDAFTELPAAGAQVLSGLSMGSSYTVKLAGARLSETALAAMQRAVDETLGDVVARMSHYDPASELSRFNRQPLGLAFELSAPTLRVFQAAQAVQAASGGAFDVAIGRAVDAWGFGPAAGARQVLHEAALAELRAATPPDALQLDAAASTLTRQHAVQANLSGIAKGYGVDQVAQALDALGQADYMVELGGEIRSRGRNTQGQPWQLAIERPDAMPQRALRIVPLSGRALATSGDYRNFFTHQGRRYSHEIDPVTAAPVTHALASVSVVADDCTTADAWSTALFVMGPQRGLDTATRLQLAAHFVLRGSDGHLIETATPAFAALGTRAAT